MKRNRIMKTFILILLRSFSFSLSCFFLLNLFVIPNINSLI